MTVVPERRVLLENQSSRQAVNHQQPRPELHNFGELAQAPRRHDYGKP